jgi:hypothetical protein
MEKRPTMQAFLVHALVAAAVVSCAALPALAAPRQAPPGQNQAPPNEQVQAAEPPDADLDRIRDALARGRTLQLDGAQRRFYLQVVAKAPSISRFFEGKDLMNGPVPRAQMTHQEYVQMITPQYMYSDVGIRPHEVIEWALTNWLAHAIVRGAKNRLAEASSDRERQRIQAQIDRELESIERAQRNRRKKN